MFLWSTANVLIWFSTNGCCLVPQLFLSSLVYSIVHAMTNVSAMALMDFPFV